MRYRHLRRTVIAVLAAIAFTLGLVLLVRAILNAPFARETAVNWLERIASEAGFELDITSLHWGYLPPRLQLAGVTLTAAHIRAEVDRLEIDLARLRVARRTFDLGTVAARGVRLELEGLPELRRPRARSPQVSVTVRHLDIRDLSFEGTELPGKIGIQLDGVAAAWTTEEDTPRGHVNVERAVLEARGIEPVEMAVRARIEVAEGVKIPTLKVTGDGVELEGDGRLSAASGAQISVAGTVDFEQLSRVIHASGQLSGRLRLSAAIDSRNRQIARIDVESDHVEAAGFALDQIRGRMTVGRDRLDGELDHALFHGGHMRGRYQLAHLTGPTRPHSLQLYGDGITLAGLLDDLDVPSAELAASFSADAELAWNGRSIKQGRGRGVATFTPLPGGIPVSGKVDCEMNSDGLLHFLAKGLSLGASTVDWQGPLTMGTWEPAWSVHASPADLGEAVGLVNSWTGSQVLPDWVSGTGDIDVTLNGPWKRLAVGVRLDAHPLLLPPIEFDRVVADGKIRGSELRLGPTRFSIGDGHGEVEGSLAWSPQSGDEQLDLTLRGHRLPLARVAQWIGVEGQADGVFSFTGGLRGPLSAPRGSWAVGVDDGSLLGQTIGDGSASVDLARGRFNARGIAFDSGLEGFAWWDLVGGTTGGSMRWREMPLELLGETMVRLVGDTANVDLDFEFPREGHVTGRLEAACPAAHISAHADPHTVTIDAKLSDAMSITADLQRSIDGSLDGPGELHLASAERLTSQLFPNSSLPLSGNALAAFTVRWPRGSWPTVQGSLDVLDLELGERPVRLLAPAQFTISGLGFASDGLRLSVLDDELSASWSVAPDGGLDGSLSGTLDVLLLRFLLPDWEPAGRANGQVIVRGTIRRPLFEGVADVSQASFRLPGTRNILSGINGTMLLSSDEFFLEGVDFRFMQGLGRVGGTLRLREGTVDLGLAGTISNLRYEVFPGLVAYLSGSWQLDGPVESLDLSGDITIDRASLRRKDDVTTLLLDWFGETSPSASVGGPRLDLHVEADETIEIRNPFLRLVGSASINISGTTSQPGIVGKVEFAEGGEITLQTVRYELERASLTFSDPLSNQPFIELQSRAWVQNYDITVRITGTPDRLVPSVASNPPLGEDEIYSLLGVGYRDQRLGRGAMGVAFASSMISREITSELERRTNLVLPIDQVRVDPHTESASDKPTARISVVKQLNPTWTFILQSNLSGERETVVVSRWYIAPGLFIETSRDIDSSYGIDLKLRRPY